MNVSEALETITRLSEQIAELNSRNQRLPAMVNSAVYQLATDGKYSEEGLSEQDIKDLKSDPVVHSVSLLVERMKELTGVEDKLKKIQEAFEHNWACNNPDGLHPDMREAEINLLRKNLEAKLTGIEQWFDMKGVLESLRDPANFKPIKLPYPFSKFKLVISE